MCGSTTPMYAYGRASADASTLARFGWLIGYFEHALDQLQVPKLRC